jgi:hypothetical protein
MRKILFALIAFASFASADWLFNPSYICAKQYWFSNGSYYYIRSDTGATVTATTKNYGDDFIAGYEYNATSNSCQKVGSNNTLGLLNEDYDYYMALAGLASGCILALSIFLGIKVS